MTKKRIGRPTDNPKPYRMALRLDQECKETVEKYCAQEKVTKMEAVRRGIKKLQEDIKY